MTNYPVHHAFRCDLQPYNFPSKKNPLDIKLCMTGLIAYKHYSHSAQLPCFKNMCHALQMHIQATFCIQQHFITMISFVTWPPFIKDGQ